MPDPFVPRVRQAPPEARLAGPAWTSAGGRVLARSRLAAGAAQAEPHALLAARRVGFQGLALMSAGEPELLVQLPRGGVAVEHPQHGGRDAGIAKAAENRAEQHGSHADAMVAPRTPIARSCRVAMLQSPRANSPRHVCSV